MGGRLGSDAAPDATEWWTELMGSAHTSTVVGIMRNLIELDVTSDLPNNPLPNARHDHDRQRPWTRRSRQGLAAFDPSI
jgi:hypothetical protein